MEHHFTLDQAPGRSTNVTALLQHRALHMPDRKVFTFLEDGETEVGSLTYDQLHRAARAVGSRLHELGATGERALLVYQPGLEYNVAFYGCLYAGVVAVPVYPPDPTRLERSLLRLRAIVENARPSIGLTTGPLMGMAKALLSRDPLFQAIRWVTTDDLGDGVSADWQEPELSSDTVAFVQYTSGSTGTPKGVMVSHGNLLHNSDLIAFGGRYDTDTVSVLWLPNYHDLGLVNGIVLPLFADFHSVLMPPVAFLQRPLRWLEAITRYRGTHCGGPNFSYELLARKVTRDELEHLDLSSWVNVYNGAEPIQKKTLERFASKFASCGLRTEHLYTVYGLAESTVAVSGGKVDPGGPRELDVDEDALRQGHVVEATGSTHAVKELVGCGHVWQPAMETVIVEPETCTPCAPDEVGEIWISSPSVAQGYWDRPEETEHTFRAYIADTDDGPYLRTGDLGFLRDGELFVTGRLKDLIIIRGQNHYPQDIEVTAQTSHPALRPGCGAAFSVEVSGEERLVVVYEVQRLALDSLNADEVIGAIRKTVMEEHELQVYGVVLLKTGSIHKTSSGKIQRRACKRGFLDSTLAAVATDVLEDDPTATDEELLGRDELLAVQPEERQAALVASMRSYLAHLLKIGPSRVDVNGPLSELGIDSLSIIELRHRIETDLAVDVPVDLLVEGVSLDQLGAHIVDQVTSGEPA